jgi:hypothetical protein
MATLPASPDPLQGLDQFLASQRIADSPRGGLEHALRGESSGPAARSASSVNPANTLPTATSGSSTSGAPSASGTGSGATGTATVSGGQQIGAAPAATSPQAPQAPQAPQQPPQQDLGFLLQADDRTVFEHVHGLVLRQELLAQNHLAQDTHWNYIVTGFPWSELTKEPNRDIYKQTLPYGTAVVNTQAVPNKAWDLLNKTTEALLVDFPIAEAEPIDATEDASAACDLANRFLEQDAGERGTNDGEVWHERTMRALFTASSYLECWCDPAGGGYVPLQIKAHPQAQDPNNPLVGPDGMPTPDYILRYVTQAPIPGPDGDLTFPPGTQFTEDGSQAAPQWQPKLRAQPWGREHVRVYPEFRRVENAEKVVILGYCTLGEGKRRWSSLNAMTPEQLSTMCDWTPTRYLPLLPPYLRARWKWTDGREKEKSSSSDERIMFYYHLYVKACPDYPKGADIVVSGTDGGLVVDKSLLAQPVEVPRTSTMADMPTVEPVREMRCMEIPIVQITPVSDPFDLDPSGRSFIELFAGACENSAHLTMSFSEILDQILHTPFSVPATSPIEGWQIEEARASGNMLLMRRPEDKPTQLTPPVIPASFFNFYELVDNAINSMASQNRPAQGADNQQEVSGKARQIAIAQNNVGLTGKNRTIAQAYARWCRIKIERAMADFDTPQQVAYVGEDGMYKQDAWVGVDFALVGKVTIKTGTGTLMRPDEKVQYLGNLQAAQMISPEEAADAARPAFAKRLGLAAKPEDQYVERSVTTWLKGPPPGWVEQAEQAQQAMQQYQAAIAPIQQQYQQAKQAHDMAVQAAQNAAPPSPQLVVQPQKPEVSQLAPPPPHVPPEPPPPQLPPPPPGPWSPFATRAIDTEPAVAATWVKKLRPAIASAKFDAFHPLWQALGNNKYTEMRQAVAIASGAQQQPQQQPGAAGQPPGQSFEQPAHPSKPGQPQSGQQTPGGAQPTPQSPQRAA